MPTKDKKSLADQLRAAIEAAEMTRYEISKQCGVEQAVLSKFVNGQRSLNLETIERLAPVLGLGFRFAKPKRGKNGKRKQ